MFAQKKLHIHPIMEVVKFTLALPLSQKKGKIYVHVHVFNSTALLKLAMLNHIQ